MYAHTDGQTTTQKHNDSGSIYRMDGGIKILKDCRNYSERFHHPPQIYWIFSNRQIHMQPFNGHCWTSVKFSHSTFKQSNHPVYRWKNLWPRRSACWYTVALSRSSSKVKVTVQGYKMLQTYHFDFKHGCSSFLHSSGLASWPQRCSRKPLETYRKLFIQKRCHYWCPTNSLKALKATKLPRQHTHTHLTALFWDYPGKLVPER